jgi:L-2,4-diaminobutyrate decarboxylase
VRDDETTGPALSEVRRQIEEDSTAERGEAFARLAAGYLDRTRDPAGRVTTALAPEELYARFDEPLPLGGAELWSVLRRLDEEVIAESIRLAHPRCTGHQVSPPLPAAIWTDLVVSALNQSVAVREMSPSMTAVETRVVRWLCDLAGLPPGAGGVMTSGGTEATFTALLAARNWALPESWSEGVAGRGAVLVCGEHAHYATTRAAGQLGIGMRNVVLIPSRGLRMDPDALWSRLDMLREGGAVVVAVVATAGTTATGSFDDLDAIADVCERHQLWLHVDGAHGASALFSDAHRARLRGLERARSISWDPHKMMLMPLPAGMLLVRDESELERAFSQEAPYLFHGAADESRRWDQGLRSFQCSRRADALKVWVALQRYGARGIGALYDHLCTTTAALHAAIVRSPDFEALHEPESNILCFRWIGDATRADTDLDGINAQLREQLNASGEGWITTTTLGGRRVLRVTVMNPRTTPDDLLEILAALRRLAPR